MIAIKRPTLIPDKLTIDGAAADLQNRQDYDNNPDDYKNLVKEFNILNPIYGHTTVKSSLKGAQHHKCCFCEKQQKDEYGAVEHFRPKKAFNNFKGEKLTKPGYFWLGYTWTNLLFVCARCNSAEFKGNQFPLKKGSTRARSHNDNLALEKPLLIDPVTVDPRKHIYFQEELVKSDTVEGKRTIKICGLDRDELNNFRKDKIDNLKARLVILMMAKYHTPQDVQQAKDYLIKAQKPDSEYSGAAIDFIKSSGVSIT